MQSVPIPGIPGYFATATGEIIGKKGKPMIGWVDEDGYRHVSLRLSGRSNPKRQSVHRLVAVAFKGPCPSPDHEVRHLDGTRTNNAPSNLEWGTRAENAADMVRHGTVMKGEKSPVAKYDLEFARRVRLLRDKGRSQQSIADELSLAQSHVSRIVRGVCWPEPERISG